MFPLFSEIEVVINSNIIYLISMFKIFLIFQKMKL